MKKTDWATLPLAGYDVESTGTDPHQDRIVSAAVIQDRPGTPTQTFTWLVNPGVEIPAEAAAIHGISNERVQAEGMDPAKALSEISGRLALAMGYFIPLVIANAPYDITMTEAENRRHAVEPLAARVAPLPIGPVIDPMVLNEKIDPYRKSCYKASGCDVEAKVHECGGCRGSRVWDCGGCGITDRKLSSLCKHYGIELVDAHDAAADALAAVQLARHLLVRFGNHFRGLTIGTLHQSQVEWKREQADRLRAFFDKVGKEHDGVPPEWPLLPTPVASSQGVPA